MKRDYGYLWGNVASGRYDRHVEDLVLARDKKSFWHGVGAGIRADVWIRGEYDRNYKKLW